MAALTADETALQDELGKKVKKDFGGLGNPPAMPTGTPAAPKDGPTTMAAADLAASLQEVTKETLGGGSNPLKMPGADPLGALSMPAPGIRPDRFTPNMPEVSGMGLPYGGALSISEGRTPALSTVVERNLSNMYRTGIKEPILDRMAPAFRDIGSGMTRAAEDVGAATRSDLGIPADPAAPVKRLPDFAQIPNGVSDRLMPQIVPGTLERPALSADAARYPASAGALPAAPAKAALPVGSLAEYRAKELKQLGGNADGLNEAQVNEAWEKRKTELNDAGLDHVEVRTALDERVAKLAAEAGRDPKEMTAEGRVRVYQEVKKEMLDRKATDFYSKYSRLTPEAGEKPTRRQKEWAAYEAVKANPRLDESKFVKPDGSIDYQGVKDALAKDEKVLAEEKRVQEKTKGAADVRSTNARTAYSEAATLKALRPDEMTPEQVERKQALASRAAGELYALENQTQTALDNKDYEGITAAQWKLTLDGAKKELEALRKDPKRLDAYRANTKIPQLARDYIDWSLTVDRGVGLK